MAGSGHAVRGDPRCQGGDPCAPTHVRGRGRRRRGDVDPRAGPGPFLRTASATTSPSIPGLKRLPAYVVSSTVPLEQKPEKPSRSPSSGSRPTAPMAALTGASPWMSPTRAAYSSWPASSARTAPPCARPRWPGPVGGRSAAATRRERRPRGCSLKVATSSTGPRSVMGMRSAVLLVVGARVRGAIQRNAAFLAGLSRVATAVMFVALVGAVVTLGWRAGAAWGAPPMLGAHSRPANHSPRSRIPLQQVPDGRRGAAGRAGSDGRRRPPRGGWRGATRTCRRAPPAPTSPRPGRGCRPPGRCSSRAKCARSRSRSASEVALLGARSIS